LISIPKSERRLRAGFSRFQFTQWICREIIYQSVYCVQRIRMGKHPPLWEGQISKSLPDDLVVWHRRFLGSCLTVLNRSSA
jgi:hypothetical protein